MASSQPRRQVILVVEDEPLLRLAAVDMVERAGFESAEAANATQAIRILETRSDIRVVFTDIDMSGGMDGMALAACIRDRWPPTAIIVTSGHVDVDDVTLPEGAVFFAKPYHEPDVVAQMTRMAG